MKITWQSNIRVHKWNVTETHTLYIAYGCFLCGNRLYHPQNLQYFLSGPLQKKFADLWCSAFPLTKHVENHSHLILTIKVSGRRGRNQWTTKADRGIVARRRVSSSGSTSSPAKEWRGQKPPRASCHSPFSPPSHLPAPTQSPLPSKSSRISCQERDLLKPAEWRLQLQKRWYFYPDLLPVCWLGVLFAGVLFCHFWYRLSPLSHQNRDVCPQ